MSRCPFSVSALQVSFAVLALILVAAPADASKLGADPDLLQAAKSGDSALAHKALLRCDDPDVIDEDGQTSLIRAVHNDHPDIVLMLLNCHASPDKTDHEGKTALFRAAGHGDALSVEALIKGGAKVDLDAKGFTPLMAAAQAGNEEAAAALLAGGAEAARLDYTGRDAADWARDAHNPELVTLLRYDEKH